MNGKEYVKQAIGLVETLLGSINDAGFLKGDGLLEDTHKACTELDGLKNKPTLRTKEGANLAFPVFDAAQNLEEEWENARETDDLDDLKWRLDEFSVAVTALSGALKDRTVVMT